MPSAMDYPAHGRINEVRDDIVVFLPSGTNYELHLKPVDSKYTGGANKPVEAIIRVQARKIWTVPSGGNFIQPISGTPRIIQGRVKWLDERTLVVHAGTNFVVDMPASEKAIDLANGAIGEGSMVNVTVMPGATFQARVPAAQAG